MSSFYFLEFEIFDMPNNGFITQQQQTLPNTKVDADPQSQITLKKHNYYKGWDYYLGIHERVEKKPRRFRGDPDYVSQSIVGGDKHFDIFFNRQENLMILNCSKDKMNGLIKRLSKEFPAQFKPISRKVNFAKLIKKVQDKNIVGSWFSGLAGDIKSIGLFGDKVNLDEQFDYYQKLGKMSALTIEIYSEDKNKPITIMITKACGVVIYERWQTTDYLDLLLNIKPWILD